MNILYLFKLMEEKGASDLHLKTAAVPILRIHGVLVPVPGLEPLSAQDLKSAFEAMTTQGQQDDFQDNKELDFSYQTQGGIRFRVNASQQKGEISLALRRVAQEIPSLDMLGLPEICQELALKKQREAAKAEQQWKQDWQRQQQAEQEQYYYGRPYYWQRPYPPHRPLPPHRPGKPIQLPAQLPAGR